MGSSRGNFSDLGDWNWGFSEGGGMGHGGDGSIRSGGDGTC